MHSVTPVRPAFQAPPSIGSSSSTVRGRLAAGVAVDMLPSLLLLLLFVAVAAGTKLVVGSVANTAHSHLLPTAPLLLPANDALNYKHAPPPPAPPAPAPPTTFAVIFVQINYRFFYYFFCSFLFFCHAAFCLCGCLPLLLQLVGAALCKFLSMLV